MMKDKIRLLRLKLREKSYAFQRLCFIFLWSRVVQPAYWWFYSRLDLFGIEVLPMQIDYHALSDRYGGSNRHER